jgi:serine protease Do
MRHAIPIVLLIAGAAVLEAPAAVNRRTPVVEAVQQALPSVVNIGTERQVKVVYSDPRFRSRDDAFDRMLREFMGLQTRTRVEQTHSLGSGVIVDESGFILTNYHVIERASKIRVMLSDDETYDALLLAGDSVNDLALIKIEAPHPLPAIRFAEDDDLLLGETVIALGNPFGLTHTVTMGVLSATNREARYDGEVLYRDILQTDAAVNPGNSGGPLVNLNGDLIGINVAIYQQAQNISFAVPVKRARALLARWLSSRLLHKTWLGFEPAASGDGLIVDRLDPEGPAARAGVKAGEALIALNGQPVRDVYTFNKGLLAFGVGDQVRITVGAGERARPVDLAMVGLPKPSGEKLARELLGLVFGSTTPVTASRARYAKGLGVQGVLAEGPAEKAGLHPGLLVTSVNDVEIQSLDDVGAALENIRPGDPVTLKLVQLVEQETFIVAQTSFVELRASGLP